MVNVASVSDPPPPGPRDGVVFANSTFTGNTATGNGGAIYQDNEDDLLQLINVTIASNTAASGGGIYNTGDGELANVSNFDDVWVVNTIIASNTGGNWRAANWATATVRPAATTWSSARPAISASRMASSTRPPPITGDPVLQPVQPCLQPAGDRDLLMPLGNDSSASATGDQAVCAAFPILNADQQGILGLTRPSPSGTNCDIGAYEVDSRAGD